MNIQPQSAVVGNIVNRSARSIGDFTVVDVGASRGIAHYWSAFGQTLHAIGFDPLVANMRKMAARETRPNVRYEGAFIGCTNFDALFPPEQRQIRVGPYSRTSSIRAQELMRLDFVAKHFNEGEEVILAERHLTLDDYFPPEAELDFLKIDTDGSDLQVLLGADKLLRRGAFLGIVVEAQFQGWPHDYANTFANIDRYLRARGFALYDLDRHRYTRAVLPGLFEYDIPAQTPPAPQVTPVDEPAPRSKKTAILLPRVKTFKNRLLQRLGLNST
jgi:FkbM family methyltransferase